jgi:signal transduction histidine kinase
VVAAACLTAGAVAVLSPRAGHVAAAAAGAAAFPVLLARAAAAVRGGGRAGRFLGIALAPLLPAALLYALTSAGVVPEALGGRHLVHLAFTITGFVMAFALADRVRAADEDVRVRLGRAVEERTMELATTVEALRREAEDRRRAEAGRRESEERLRHAQRIEAVGRLAGGIAHDYNNLLTSVSTNVSILRMEPPPPPREQQEILQDVAEAVSRGAALTRQLLVFSRRQVLSPQPLAVNRVVEGLRRLLDRLIGENYRLQLELASALPSIVADPAQLEQVVMNLVLNARDAMPDGGTIRIATAEVEVELAEAVERSVAPGRFIRLSIADSGPGIPPEVLSHVFEPFFTTKAEGKGTGLGLATVHGVASQHGGFVDVDPGLGRGAVFHVHLPLGDARAVAGPAGARKERRLPRGDETILLVEDDAVMREATRRLLTRLGYRVLTAHDAAEALRACEEEKPPDLVITDLVMPGMDGLALAARVRERHPSIPILLVSGHGADVLAAHRVERKDLPFLGKPYTPEALAERVRELLDPAGTPA